MTCSFVNFTNQIIHSDSELWSFGVWYIHGAKLHVVIKYPIESVCDACSWFTMRCTQDQGTAVRRLPGSKVHSMLIPCFPHTRTCSQYDLTQLRSL